MATAVLAAAILTAVPTLPTPTGVDHTADEVRLHIVHQIKEHRAFVHKVRQQRREAAMAATSPVPSQSSPPDVTYSGTWADELAAVGFPSSAIPTMLYIINRESGGDPSAINPTSGACGLTQLYPCPGPGALDPMTNLRYAYLKYQASGFAPWAMS